MRYYGIKPRTTEVRAKERHGDVEAGHGVLKRKLEHALLARDSRDFESVEAWQAFVDGVARKANAARGKRDSAARRGGRAARRARWLDFLRYLHHLVELEVHERRRHRIERYQRQSELPADKTLATLTRSRLPTTVAEMLPTLCEGGFVERGDNLLAFGLPGRGNTHLMCAIGHELIQRGYRVLFVATFALVQRLLAAKRDLRLEEKLAILDGFDAVLLDDIGYVQQSRATRWRCCSPSSPSGTSDAP